MVAARFAVFAIFCFSVCANAQTRTLVVYPGPATGLDSLSTHFLTAELRRVLAPAGIDLSWRSPSGMHDADEEIARIVVGSFDGDCSIDSRGASVAPSDGPGVLAETSISDDRVLPYFNVRCGRVLRALAPTLEPLSAPFRAEVLGRALARVIAHEIYHIVAQTTDHGESGVAKPELSRDDLVSSRFDLSAASLRRMRTAFQPATQTVLPGGLAAAFVPR